MTTTQPFDIHRALSSFNLALRAQNKSPGTVGLYSLAVRQLIVFPEGEEHSCQITESTRYDINDFLSGLHEIHKPSTVDTRYRSLKAFFKFLKGDATARGQSYAKGVNSNLPEIQPTMTYPK